MSKPRRESPDPCLLFGEATALDRAAEAIEAHGRGVKRADREADAIAFLGREPLSAAVVAHPVSPSVLASLLAAAARRHPEIPVLVLGSTTSVEEAVDAMRAGAGDYLPPPIEPAVLALRLQRILGAGAGAGGGGVEASSRQAPSVPGLVGNSPAMASLFDTIEKVSRYKTNVLLLGESGTGKELVARGLHARGPRRHKLFVPVNCATLGRELLENELFGHERGAFTGASERKKGLFELADGGTLFLDEIGEMDPSTQAKLLRVLERNEFRRVGGTEKVKVDLSVIAATHRNLADYIAHGKFRDDLYYRLKVVTIIIAPLRERREDIPVLIDHFIADFNARNSQKIRGIAPALLRRFMQYDWPGNVRELKNAVESAAILTSDQTLDADPIGSGAPSVQTSEHIAVSIGATLEQAERQLIMAHVARSRSKMDAARTLGIGLRTLYTKLQRYEQND